MVAEKLIHERPIFLMPTRRHVLRTSGIELKTDLAGDRYLGQNF